MPNRAWKANLERIRATIGRQCDTLFKQARKLQESDTAKRVVAIMSIPNVTVTTWDGVLSVAFNLISSSDYEAIMKEMRTLHQSDEYKHEKISEHIDLVCIVGDPVHMSVKYIVISH